MPDELHVLAARLLLHAIGSERVGNHLLAGLVELNEADQTWVLAEARRRIHQQDKKR